MKQILVHIQNKFKDKQNWIEKIFFLVFFTLQSLFLKEAWVGKSFLYKDADYRVKKAGEERLKKLGWEDEIKKKTVDTFDYNELAKEIGLEDLFSKVIKDFNINKYTFKYIKSRELIEKRGKGIWNI